MPWYVDTLSEIASYIFWRDRQPDAYFPVLWQRMEGVLVLLSQSSVGRQPRHILLCMHHDNYLKQRPGRKLVSSYSGTNWEVAAAFC